MKKQLGLITLGAALLLSVSVTGQAASINGGNGQSRASVSLSKGDDVYVELLSAPDFDFGAEQVTGSELNIDAHRITDPLKVVNPGLADGWNVTVKANQFMVGAGEAELTLGNGIVASDAGNISIAPTLKSLTLSTEDQEIFTAKPGSGIGAWTATYDYDDVHLKVPSSATPGNYQTDITWTLSDMPQP